MKLRSFFWNNFHIQNENADYIDFSFNNFRHRLLKKDHDCGVESVNFIEFTVQEILQENFLNILEENLKKNHIRKLFFRINPIIEKGDNINKCLELLLSKNYSFRKTKCIILNLKQEINVLRSNIRKSYKSLINKENKILDIRFSNIDSSKQEIFNSWINIYSKAISRGGKKISHNSIELLKKCVENQECIIALAYEKKKAVGGMLFYIEKNLATYSAAANISLIEEDRKRSVGHYLMWNSIVHLKDKGIKFLELGTLENYKDDNIKNYNISKFKSGFGGEELLEYYLKKSFLIL
tara:strand:- start:2828 stop:3712 length:885 start_codon:yes stop_codon:yes gene_type:complete